MQVSDGVRACRPEENLAPAAQKGRRGGKKKRVQLDVGPDHRPATQLDGQSIRALLKDRAPLLRPRQALAERSLAAQRFQVNAADLVSICPILQAFDLAQYHNISSTISMGCSVTNP